MATGRTIRAGGANRGLLPLLIPLLLLLALPSAAPAQNTISEVMVICGGSSSIAAPDGYEKVNVDLNKGCGGDTDYIYLCVRRGPGAPITGLTVTLNSGVPSPTSVAWQKVNVDLNRNAGGDFVYLWYTKDPSCTMIKNITVLEGLNTAPPSGYVKIPVDLNSRADGAYLYFAYLAQ